jgi:hypothetical protein
MDDKIVCLDNMSTSSCEPVFSIGEISRLKVRTKRFNQKLFVDKESYNGRIQDRK